MLGDVVRAAHADVAVDGLHPLALDRADRLHLTFSRVAHDGPHHLLLVSRNDRLAARVADGVDELDGEVDRDVERFDQHFVALGDLHRVMNERLSELGEARIFHGPRT